MAYHHGDLREALITAGRSLLEEKGLTGFTLRECARRAEVSHAAPAHHFKSVDDLLAEIATQGFGQLMETMAAEARRAKPDPAAPKATPKADPERRLGSFADRFERIDGIWCFKARIGAMTMIG